ncbi:hypothetical protein R69888_06482 [Paraburkholderia haematera]|jgi:Uncharacterized protein conserved in bacteria|uniref:CsbD-like domain-containing protein n=2 Tax=Paraburkholderia haematera TaxID=2793077 RepID=A0ABN7N1P4_9BURK|nr:hypothetical protein R69888_06482 [Paraburkholderia haematera]
MLGKAKAAWGELTDDDLTKAEGRVEKLTGLIQERYGKTRQQAELEVRRFFDSNRDF